MAVNMMGTMVMVMISVLALLLQEGYLVDMNSSVKKMTIPIKINRHPIISLIHSAALIRISPFRCFLTVVLFLVNTSGSPHPSPPMCFRDWKPPPTTAFRRIVKYTRMWKFSSGNLLPVFFAGEPAEETEGKSFLIFFCGFFPTHFYTRMWKFSSGNLLPPSKIIMQRKRRRQYHDSFSDHFD